MTQKPTIQAVVTAAAGDTGATDSRVRALADARNDFGVLRSGTRAGEYVVEGLIGRGGMGAVYAARQPVIGKRVAIKVLSGDLTHDAALVQRFVDEARAVNKIGHPNIIDIFSFGQLGDGQHYYVMELLDGQSLRERLNVGRLAPALLDRYLTQLCSALQAAHDMDIIHRDLKPENIWLSTPKHAEPQLKLLDFGIAKFFEPSSARGREPLTELGVVLGTPSYMSPEQCSGDRVDLRTDIYALGVMLYEFYMDALPFVGSPLQLITQHVTAPPPKAANAREPVAALIAACLAKDPEARPRQARELLERFRRACGAPGASQWQLGLEATAPSVPPIALPIAPWPKASGRVRALAVALFVLAVLGLVSYAWLGASAPERSMATAPTPVSPRTVSTAADTSPPAIVVDARMNEPPPTATKAAEPRPLTPTPTPAATVRHARERSNVDRRGLATENPFR